MTHEEQERKRDEDKPYECPPFAMPADLFYIAIGAGLLLVLVALALGASS